MQLFLKKSLWRHLNEALSPPLSPNLVCSLRDHPRSHVPSFSLWPFWLSPSHAWSFYWGSGSFVERITLRKTKTLREFWNRFLAPILDTWTYPTRMFRILHLPMGIFKYNHILYLYWMYTSLYMSHAKVKENKDIKNEKTIYLFHKDNNAFIWSLHMIRYTTLYGKQKRNCFKRALRPF